MKTWTRKSCGRAITAAMLVLAAAGAPFAHASDEAVRAAVMDYAEGWHTGDEARMARAVHPEMRRLRVVTDVLSNEERVLVMDAEALVRAAAEGRGTGDAPTMLSLRVAILDRHGDLASARVVSPLYVEYLQLVRWSGRWVVLSALWGTVAAPGD